MSVQILGPVRAMTAERRLASAFRGRLLRSGDPRYESARTLFNGMIDRRPRLIAQCVGTADIVAAIHYARAADMPLSVRGGGHGVQGNAIVDDGLVIDLRRMGAVHVDAEAGTALAQAGALWGHLDVECDLHGLGTTGGTYFGTGIAGLTLGGGYGWLQRKHGLTVDNVLRIHAVSADGELLRADADSHPDLFWAMRGGGGNFALASAFEYQLHPVGEVLAAWVFTSLEHAAEAMRFFRDFMADAPDELGAIACIVQMPEGAPLTVANCPPAPRELQGRPVFGITMLYAGDPTEGELLIEPLRRCAPAPFDLARRMRYPEAQFHLIPATPYGLQNYWKGAHIDDLSDDVIERLVECGHQLPSPFTTIHVTAMGGAVGRASPDATAFPRREGAFFYNILNFWTDPAENDSQITWTREWDGELTPFSVQGAYFNLNSDSSEDRIRAVYEDKYDLLVSVKDRYDPENVFRFNQNIKPSPAQVAATG